ncbi:hypothetical protein D3C72_1664100 [compost metagenome]
MTASMDSAGSLRAMLSRTERLNRIFSCSTTPIWRRSEAVSMTAISCPSISTLPRSGIYRRCASRVKVLLPEPERPTMPITSPGAMAIDTLRSTSAASGR